MEKNHRKTSGDGDGQLMVDTERTKILSSLAAPDFVGRSVESERVLEHARNADRDAPAGLLLLAAPAIGLSELLRQSFDHLFNQQSEIVPFYFAINRTDKTVENLALRFLREFLTHTIAFQLKDSGLTAATREIYELAEIAPPAERSWIDNLIAAYERENKLGDQRSLIRLILSAPFRRPGNEAKFFVMIDDFHNLENFSGEINLAEEFKDIYSRSKLKFVLAGRRRYVLSATRIGKTRLNDVGVLHLNPLTVAETGILTAKLSRNGSVEINDQTQDLIARQLSAKPEFIESLFAGAAARNTNLNSFQSAEQNYVEELFGGRLSKYYDTLFDEIAPNLETQKRIIKLWRETSAAENGKMEISDWQKDFDYSETEFRRMIEKLYIHEFINLDADSVKVSGENIVLGDYFEARYRLDIAAESRARVVGDSLKGYLKRASQLMARFYRRETAIELRELLSVFNCQSIPQVLLQYKDFKEKVKGSADEEILGTSESKSARITLPQIIYTAFCAAFYPPILQVSDEERSAVAIGFDSSDYRGENEIAWLAAELDSKLEASRELTEFWCDRLEAAALMCNFEKFQIWLIAPEGFSPEAVEILEQRKAFGSSRKQVELMAKRLSTENLIRKKTAGNEYEMIVPMGEDTEMIAAHAVEEIARRHHFQPKAITQIKTALVEACINAAEHSQSPDRKIYQKFSVEDDKIVITISNRGVKIPAKKAAEMNVRIDPDAGRRGWGLKLMRSLMDEVKFEQVDDGTKISMVKYLN